MSIGWLLALLVLLASLFVMVFKPAAPEWLPAAMDAMLALAIMLSPVSFKAPWQA